MIYNPIKVSYHITMANTEHKTKGETMAATTLNQIAKLIGSSDKNEVISVAILTLHKELGVPMPKAYEMILGEGAWQEMANEIHDELNK